MVLAMQDPFGVASNRESMHNPYPKRVQIRSYALNCEQWFMQSSCLLVKDHMVSRHNQPAVGDYEARTKYVLWFG